MSFIHDIGVPRDLVTAGAREETSGERVEVNNKLHIR